MKDTVEKPKKKTTGNKAKKVAKKTTTVKKTETSKKAVKTVEKVVEKVPEKVETKEVKKVSKKPSTLRWVGIGLSIASIILFIVAIFVNNVKADIIVKLVGALFYLVSGMIIALTSDNHRLAKSLLVFISLAIILTWLFPWGYYQGAEFYDNGMYRIGLSDFGVTLYNAINWESSADKIIFLFMVAGFYGVLSKISGYQNLVNNLANKLKKHAIVTTIVISVLLFAFASLFNFTFAIMLFIPFFISVLLRMNLDKLTTYAITFGSALVGILGCTYGTGSLIDFNAALAQEVTVGLNYRFIIAAVALVLYLFFLVMRVRKVKDNNTNNDVKSDPFLVEEAKEKISVLPIAIVLGILAIFVILCYVNWKTIFGITMFDDFHAWLIALEVGDGFTIMSYLLGSFATAFGTYNYGLFIGAIIILVSALIAFLYKMKVNEYIEAFFAGVKKMLKPILFVIAVYLVFVTMYHPVTAYIGNWLNNLVKGFNPYITSLIAFITSIFQVDSGNIAQAMGGLITAVYPAKMEIIHTIFMSIFGLVQVFMPTSALMVAGLSLMDVDYKSWLKYIWLFVVGMLVILLVLFTVITYI